MYLAYLIRRKPTIRECRLASVVAAAGWLGIISGLLALPGGGRAAADRVALSLFALLYFGMAPLTVRRGQARVFGLYYATALVAGVPPLDERELSIRYRTFHISYQVLTVVIILGFVGSAWPQLSQLFRLWQPRVNYQEFAGLIISWCFMLPHMIMPWLESEVGSED